MIGNTTCAPLETKGYKSILKLLSWSICHGINIIFKNPVLNMFLISRTIAFSNVSQNLMLQKAAGKRYTRSCVTTQTAFSTRERASL